MTSEAPGTTGHELDNRHDTARAAGRQPIYIGAPIDNVSERRFLEATVRSLQSAGIPFVVLANFHVQGRQIDCVVGTPDDIAVIEVKSSHLPIVGEMNGDWSRVHADGATKPYGNAYLQALHAKNAFRDAMMALRQAGDFYPNAYVVFEGGIPEQSNLTRGDFKVRVTSCSTFLSDFPVRRSPAWTLGDLETLAAQLSLSETALEDVLATPEGRLLASILDNYNRAFAAEFECDGARWLPEHPAQKTELVEQARRGTGCFITGPSGCGKTLMAKSVATDLARAGNPTIFVAGREFSGTWRDQIRREIGLLVRDSHTTVLRAIRESGRPLTFVLDGTNELGRHQSVALRGLRALAQRHCARLVVTSQDRKPPQFRRLQTVAVRPPSFALKCRIAESVTAPLPVAAKNVLNAVTSGFEAELVGHVASDLRPLKSDVTRVLLVDQYVRKRLRHVSRNGASGLRRLAVALHDRVAFSLTEVEFDELMEVIGVDADVRDALIDGGLLVRRLGRIAFAHEIILNAFAAHQIALRMSESPERSGHLLATPRFKGLAGDIISTVQDESTCRRLLRVVADTELLSGAASGQFGSLPGRAMEELLAEVNEKCVGEIEQVRLILKRVDGAMQLAWDATTMTAWSDAERSRLGVIGVRAATGIDAETYLALCREMDERLDMERRRLSVAAKAAGFALRSRSFWLTYVPMGGGIGFCDISRMIPLGQMLPREGPPQPSMDLDQASSGQLYFLTRYAFSRLVSNDAVGFARQLIGVLRTRFRTEPYNVRLALLDAAHVAGDLPGDVVKELTDAIEGLEISPNDFGMSTHRTDVLGGLGAFDSEGERWRNGVKEEIGAVLGSNGDDVARQRALALCTSMLDHVFDWVYREEIERLAEAQRRRLFRLALSAEKTRDGMWCSWLSREVAAWNERSDVPLFAPFTALPNPSAIFPQERLVAFVVSVRFLARYEGELVSEECRTTSERCLREVRTLVYAAESGRPGDRKAAWRAWEELDAMPVQVVVGCLVTVQQAIWESGGYPTPTESSPAELDLAAVYTEECLRTSRRFVTQADRERGFWPWQIRESGCEFAFRTIGRYGDRSDLSALRARAVGHEFATYAVDALKLLDAGGGRVEDESPD